MKNKLLESKYLSYGFIFFILTFILISFGVAYAVYSPNVDPTPAPSTNGIWASPTAAISPNGDGQYDTVSISHVLNSDGYVNLRVYTNSASTTPLRNLYTNSFQNAGVTQSAVWNGQNEGGQVLSDDTYRVRLDDIGYRGTLTSSPSLIPSQIAVDNTTNPPTYYAADSGAGNNRAIWRSTNSGQTWTEVPITGGQLPNSPVIGVGVINVGASPPTGYNANTIYLYFTFGTSRLFWETSVDGGNSWSGNSRKDFKAGLQLQQLAIDSNGSVYVAAIDASPPDRLMKYFYDPGVPGWVVSGMPAGFIAPRGVAIEGLGNIYVSDNSTSALNPNPGRIWKSTDGGNSFSVLIDGNTTTGKVSTPGAIFYTNSRLWVADTGNNRVQQFWASDGSWIQSIQGAGQYGLNYTSSMSGIAVDADNYALVSDTGNNRLQRYINDNLLGVQIQVDNTKPIDTKIDQVVSAVGVGGLYHRGIITISASASDLGTGVERIQYYRDDSLMTGGIILGSSSNYAWNTTLLDDGYRSLRVNSYDNVANTQTSSYTYIYVDNTPPVASITSPTSSMVKSGVVSIIGDANDGVALDNYVLHYNATGSWQQFYQSLNPVFNNTMGSLDTTTLPDGSIQIRVTATDKVNYSSQATSSFTIDNASPSAVLDELPSSVTGTVPISGTATDANFLRYYLEWGFGNKPVGDSSGWNLFTIGYSTQPGGWLADWDSSIAPTGVNTIRLSVEDVAGKISREVRTTIVDNTPPTADITDPATNSYKSPNTSVIGSANDTYFSSYTLEYGSGASPASWTTISYSTSAVVSNPLGTLPGSLTNGQYTVRVRVSDSGGLTNSASKTFYVDSDNPNAVLDNLPASVNGMVDLRGVATDSYFSSYTLQWGSGVKDANATTGWNAITDAYSQVTGPSGLLDTWDASSASSGTVTVRLSVTDLAGKVTRTVKTTIVDNTPPTADITDPATNSYKSPNTSVIGSANDTYFSSYTLEYGSGASPASWTTISYSTSAVVSNPLGTLPGSLTNGQYTVRVRVSDSGGLTNSASKTFYVDSENPNAVLDNLPTSVNSLVDLRGIATDAYFSSYTLEWGAGVKDPYATGWSFITSAVSEVPGPNGLLDTWDASSASSGTVTVRLSVFDLAGKVLRTVKQTVVDNTPPTADITDPATNSYKSPSASVIGSANDTYFSSYTLEYGSGASPASWTTISYSTSAVVSNPLGTLPGSLTNGQYTVRVRVSDSGGLTNSASKTFYVDSDNPNAVLDNLPTSVNSLVDLRGIATDAYFSSYTLEWGAGVKDPYATGWSFITSAVSEVPGPNGLLDTWDASSASSGTVTVRLSVFDLAGKVLRTVKQTVVDNTPPTADITDPATNSYKSPSASVIGSASDTYFSSYTLEYGSGGSPSSWTTISYSTSAVVSNPLGSLPGSLTNGQYTVRVRVSDSGGLTNSATKTFYVDSENPNAVLDNLPASVNSLVDLRGIATDSYFSSYTLEWGAGVKDPYATGWSFITSAVSEVPGPSGLLDTWDASSASSGTVTVRLSVFDLAGKVSRVAKLTIVDKTGPDVSVGDAIPSPFAPGTNSTQIPQITATDVISGVGNWKVDFYTEGYGTPIRTITSTANGVANLNTSIDWDGKKDDDTYITDGRYEYIFTAYDTLGNSNSTQRKLVKADTSPPTIESHSADPTYFSPNGDFNQDNVDIEATIDDLSPVTWAIKIIQSSTYSIVKNESGSGYIAQYTWDGKIGGNKAAEDKYIYEIKATDSSGNESTVASGEFYLDTGRPVADTSQPSANPFSPNASLGVRDTTTVSFTGSDPYPESPIVYWSLRIEDSIGSEVRTYEGVGSFAESQMWDGKNNGGSYVADGIYNYILTVGDAAGNIRFVSPKSVTVDNTPPVIGAVSSNPQYFSPLDDGNGFTTTSLNAAVTDNLSNINWAIDVKDSIGEVTKSFSDSGTLSTSINQVWDGKNLIGDILTDGTYSYHVNVSDAAGNAAAEGQAAIVIDNTKPDALITEPVSDARVLKTVSINGTANDLNINKYEFYIGLGASPTSWTKVGEGIQSIIGEKLYDWDTTTITQDDNYTLKLIVTDKAGNIESNQIIISVENRKLVADITYPDENQIISGSVPIIGTATNSNLASFKSYKVEAQLQGTLTPGWTSIFASPTSIIDATLGTFETKSFKDGDYIIRVTSTDKDNNITYKERVVKVDNAPPSIGSLLPADKSIVSSDDYSEITITGVADNVAGIELGTSAVEMVVNNSRVSAAYDDSTDTIKYSPQGGLSGYYSVNVNVSDKVGNWRLAPTAWSFTVDSDIPQANIDMPTPGSTVGIAGGKVAITGTASDTNMMQYRLEQKLTSSSTWANISTEVPWSATSSTPVINGTLSVWKLPLVAGEYDLRLTVSDKAGRTPSIFTTTIYVAENTSENQTQYQGQSYNASGEKEFSDKIEITSPETGSFVRGKVAIKGSASLDSNFNRYIVSQRQISPSYTPTVAILTSTAPIKDGTLATWDSTGKNGIFQIRVDMYDTSAVNVEPATSSYIEVTADNTAPTYPKTLSLSPANNSFITNNRPVVSFGGARDVEPIAGKKVASGVSTSSITMKVDGEVVPIQYSDVTKIVSHQPSEENPLTNGKHTVVLEIKDHAGNSSTPSAVIKWSFTIATNGIFADVKKPVNNQKIRGTYPIAGVAYAKNLLNYQIQYYPINDPKSQATPQWKTLISSVKPVGVSGGTLFKWVTNLNAVLKIRLIVKDKAGNVSYYPAEADPKHPSYSKYAGILVTIDNKAPAIDIPDPGLNSFAKTKEGEEGTGVIVPVSDALDTYMRPGTGIDKSRTILKLNDRRVVTTFDDETNTINYLPTNEDDSKGIKDGVYNASLTVYDVIGNAATKNWKFTVDNTKPEAQIVFPIKNSPDKVKGTIPVNGTAFDKNLLSYTVEYKLIYDDIWVKAYVGKINIKNGTLVQWKTPVLDLLNDYEYELKLTVIDRAGNISVFPPDIGDPYKFTVNQGATMTYGSGISEIVSPTDGAYIAGSKIPINGTAFDSDFKNYFVYAKSYSTGAKGTIQSATTPIIGGTLATWDAIGKNGKYDIELVVNRNDGTSAGYTKTVTIDSVKPIIKSTSPAAGTFLNSNTPTISVNYTENIGMSTTAYTVWVDGFPVILTPSNHITTSKSFSYIPSVPLLDGAHSVVVEGSDMVGNAVKTLTPIKFTVDTNNNEVPMVPTAKIDYPAPGGFAGGIVSINGTAFDQNIKDYKLQYTTDSFEISSKLIATKTSNIVDASLAKWTTTGLSGLHKVKLTLTDKAGNIITDSVEFNIDNKLPSAAITKPVVATPLSVVTNSYSIEGTADDLNFDNYKVEYRLLGTTNWVTINSSTQSVSQGTLATWNTNSLMDGKYTLRLTTTDKANNKSISTVQVFVDNTKPTVSIISPMSGAWSKMPLTVTGTQFDANIKSRRLIAEEIISGETVSLPTSATSVTNTTLGSFTNLTSGYSYKITAIAVDRGGNTDSKQVIVNIDTSPPIAQITAPIANATISGSYSIVGTANDLLSGVSSYKVEYKIGTNSPVLIKTASYSVENSELALWDTTQRQNTTYSLILTVTDIAKNTAAQTVTLIKINNP